MNRLVRAAFVVYALALLAATLWPQLEIQGPVQRTDLWLHTFAFGLWGLLLYLSEFIAPRTSWKNVALSGFVSLAWGGVNEWSQQFVNRITAADDFAANALGVWIAMGISAVWCARSRAAADA